jgi:hypothetical protein
MNTESTGWRVVVDAPDALAYAVLWQDRVWNCCAIADLTPPFRAYSQIAVASRTDPPGDAACLVLRHPALTVISPFGPEQGVAAILAHLQLDLPDTALVQAHDAQWPLCAPYYRFRPDRQELLRLGVTAHMFQEPPSTAAAGLRAADDRGPVDLAASDSEIKVLIGCTPQEAVLVARLHNQGNQYALLVRRSPVAEL